MNEQQVQASHTPGPWVVERSGTSISVVREESLMTIASMAWGPVTGRSEANAALIAAAPDLLTALQAVCADWVNPYDGGPFEDGEMPALDKARAAIAKATGRTAQVSP